jgi:hypothetical protein
VRGSWRSSHGGTGTTCSAICWTWRNSKPTRSCGAIPRAGELAQLSRRHGHDMLGYLLDMAQLEADEIVRRDLTSQL